MPPVVEGNRRPSLVAAAATDTVVEELVPDDASAAPDDEGEALARQYRDLAAVELAVEQIRQERAPGTDLDPAALLAALPALPELPGLDADTLKAALEALAASHRATVEGAVALVASAARERGAANGEQIALAAIDALRAAASAPAAPAPSVTVNVPEQNVTVEPANVTVTLPEQPAPSVTVNVPESPAPVVNIAAAEPAPAPVIHVAAAEAPKVEVTVQPAPVAVTVPAAKPRSVRVEYDDRGERVFIAEDLPEGSE